MTDQNASSPEWQKRLSDVKVFNAYASENSVNLKKAFIEKPLDGLTLTQGEFTQVFWKNTSVKKSKIENVSFVEGAIEAVDFSGSEFKNVVFKGMTIANSNFSGSILLNIQFVDCQLVDVKFEKLAKSNITLLNSKASGLSFAESAVQIKLEGTSLSDTTAYKLAPSSSLKIEKSKLLNLDVTGNLSSLTITNSDAEESAFSGTVDGDITIDGGNVKFGAVAVADNVLIKNLESGSIGAGGETGSVNSIIIENCQNIDRLGLKSAKKINISRIQARRMSIGKTTAGDVQISDSVFQEWEFYKSKIDSLTVKNVSLQEKLSLEQAQIGSHNLQELSTGEHIEIFTEGSNVHWKR